MKIAIAGGTGLVGSKVVAKVRAAGHEPVVIARSRGTNLITGEGLLEALRDCRAVIDVSNVVTTRKKVSIDFFSRATANLLRAARQADVDHLVTLSIVGCDAVDLGYYFGKRVQEELVEAGDVPWTILRATQFFEFPEPLLAMKSPIAVIPRMLSQPVAADEVAEALTRYATQAPAGHAPDLAGPERLQMTDMARRLLTARGRHRPVLPLPIPGRLGEQLATGALLPQGDHTRSPKTFAQHLTETNTTTER
ncbi:SDR family oxidoreductase [Saccharopolyspora endophytica]|uniref:SDR family oxidoreductase n=1 Tax=Saccharopolyspora endophytica TaxID=543886 RepID=A0ABS5D8T1_9PSEU|nr:SDR family oxidoreductase [Saccharopolyspora endophytica]MBQ0922703.1 SDR family oxidoreductase [Saccharopolyspora endophytica]